MSIASRGLWTCTGDPVFLPAARQQRSVAEGAGERVEEGQMDFDTRISRRTVGPE
jgi:hypothetical protein